jgi:hypothetical protein
MFFLNIHRYSLLLIFILSSVNAEQSPSQTSFSPKLKSTEYQRLAKYCYIDDYSAWLERQREFMIWFDLAKMLRLPIKENQQFQQELKRYRLQYECLRIIEHLPIVVGPG